MLQQHPRPHNLNRSAAKNASLSLWLQRYLWPCLQIGFSGYLALACNLASAIDPAPTLALTHPASHAVVLVYHHVSERSPAITSVSPAQFEQQLQYLAYQQFSVWPLEKIVRFLKSKQALPDKVVAISFDDNYRSVYQEAFPRLKARGWPFTIFVSSDAVDQRHQWQANWQQLREMAADGATIANHSASHGHLLQQHTQESDSQWQQRIRLDIMKGGRRIEQEIGTVSRLFAYPYGEYNQALSTLVAELGYTAFGQHSGAIGQFSHPQQLPRFAIAGQYAQLGDFGLKVHTLALPVTATIDVMNDNPLGYFQLRPKLSLRVDRPLPSIHLLRCFGSGQGELQLSWQDKQFNHVNINPGQDIPVGRSRYNCTLPTANGRFYWYSKPWIRLDDQGRLPGD